MFCGHLPRTQAATVCKPHHLCVGEVCLPKSRLIQCLRQRMCFNGALEMGSRGRPAGETSCFGTPQFYRLRSPYQRHHSKIMLLGHLRAMRSDIQHNTHIYEECTLPSLCMQTGPMKGSDDFRGRRPIPKPRNVISTEGEPEGGKHYVF